MMLRELKGLVDCTIDECQRIIKVNPKSSFVRGRF